jgi:ATP-dependent protease ClpP protease subunit
MIDLAKFRNLADQVKAREKKFSRPAAAKKPWEFRNLDANTTVVYIYDLIGDWGYEGGVAARDFVVEFDAITTANITIRINSQGGHVFDGQAIFEAIARHPSNTLSVVDGVAASAASFIALAADRVEMSGTAKMMVHDAGVGGIYIEGNAAELREAIEEVRAHADLLDSLSDTIAQIYADKTGGTVEEWRAIMAAGDKWYTAEEALAAKLIDGIVGQNQDDPSNHTNGTPSNQSPHGNVLPTAWDVEGLLNALKGACA